MTQGLQMELARRAWMLQEVMVHCRISLKHSSHGHPQSRGPFFPSGTVLSPHSTCELPLVRHRTKGTPCQVQFTPVLAARNVLQVHTGALGAGQGQSWAPARSLWELLQWGQLLTLSFWPCQPWGTGVCRLLYPTGSLEWESWWHREGWGHTRAAGTVHTKCSVQKCLL